MVADDSRPIGARRGRTSLAHVVSASVYEPQAARRCREGTPGPSPAQSLDLCLLVWQGSNSLSVDAPARHESGGAIPAHPGIGAGLLDARPRHEPGRPLQPRNRLRTEIIGDLQISRRPLGTGPGE